MNNILRNYMLLALMLIAVCLAIVLRPTQRIADLGPKINLEQMIPKQFGEWTEDKSVIPIQANPVTLANLNYVYTQILSRTYINKLDGKRIMLSVAYGNDQRRDTAVHYPEVCYPAQGFQVFSKKLSQLKTPFGNIQTRELETRFNERFEPITYWITIGNYVTLTEFDRRIKELRYGLHGLIPDGLLFRISSIDRNSAQAFGEHEKFVAEMFRYIPEPYRNRFAGNFQG